MTARVCVDLDHQLAWLAQDGKITGGADQDQLRRAGRRDTTGHIQGTSEGQGPRK
jgi:hypothetical protein